MVRAPSYLKRRRSADAVGTAGNKDHSIFDFHHFILLIDFRSVI
jgi:hypothetical protein